MNSKKLSLELRRLDQCREKITPVIKRIEEGAEGDTIYDAIHLLQDIEVITQFIQKNLYDFLIETDPETETNWYLYSKQTVRLNNNADLAFDMAQKSVDLLAQKNKTFSAISRHYIELAVNSGKLQLAKSEYERISKLLHLTVEQETYLVGGLPPGVEEFLKG